MEFLQSCARRLNDGEDGAAVMDDMKTRYTTTGSLNSKMSIVRSMIRPTAAFEAAVRARLEGEPEETIVKALKGGRHPKLARDHDAATDRLPSRWPESVWTFRIGRAEIKTHKKNACRARIQKNAQRLQVNGRQLLSECRSVIDAAERACPAKLALALMLVTGRRMCEILNGCSRFVPCEAPFRVSFAGQAKQRVDGHNYVIPVLHDVESISAALRIVASRFPPAFDPHDDQRTKNRKTSRAYQSRLSRTLHGDAVLAQTGRPHALRGAYACMCASLFVWENDPAPAYVTMFVLGHKSIEESLVYTTYNLGTDFACEPMLDTVPFSLA